MASHRAIGYNFDYDYFDGSVHGRLPYNLLKPDLVLRQLLQGLSLHKLIFTNADKAYASRVLNRFGLEDCFDGIICFETLNTPVQHAASPNSNRLDESDVSADKTAVINNPSEVSGTKSALPKTPDVCKPVEDAYKQVFKIAGINPQRTVFFDDSVRNLQTSKQMGLHTVLVGTSHRTKGVDHPLESIHIMREGLPELWEADEKSEGINYSGKVAIEMPVRA